MKQRNIFTTVAALVLMASVFSTAYAQERGTVEVKTVAEQEKVFINEKGEREIRRVPVEKVTPGDEVIYTTWFTNVGKDVANDIVITNPIPTHTHYKGGSALGDKTEITYSIDGGKRYALPDQLQIREEDGKERLARAEEYTHVQWIYRGSLAPTEKRFVRFRVVLK